MKEPNQHPDLYVPGGAGGYPFSLLVCLIFLAIFALGFKVGQRVGRGDLRDCIVFHIRDGRLIDVDNHTTNKVNVDVNAGTNSPVAWERRGQP
jgi:hypothetical protein